MTPPALHSHAAKDSLVAGILVAAPAWAPWLADVNELLTTVTLLCGAVLGIGRLWLFVRRRMDRGGADRLDP